MTTIDRYEYERRWREFSGPIGNLALNNALIHNIATMYARGDIATKEEALSQMVIHLEKASGKLINEAVNRMPKFEVD